MWLDKKNMGFYKGIYFFRARYPIVLDTENRSQHRNKMYSCEITSGSVWLTESERLWIWIRIFGIFHAPALLKLNQYVEVPP